MVAEDSILPATAVQKKSQQQTCCQIIGMDGTLEKIQTSLILTQIISILQNLF